MRCRFRCRLRFRWAAVSNSFTFHQHIIPSISGWMPKQPPALLAAEYPSILLLRPPSVVVTCPPALFPAKSPLARSFLDLPESA